MKANASGGADLSIPSSAIVHNGQAYWKANRETPNNYLNLKVLGNSFEDETVVRFVQDATANWDINYDAYKLFSHDLEVFQIYTINDDIEYAVNTLPELSNQETIPLRLLYAPQTIEFIVNEFNFPFAKVFIRDIVTDEIYELLKNYSLSFENANSDAFDRFELIFEYAPSGVKDMGQLAVSVYPNPTSGIFFIAMDENIEEYELMITNVLGETVLDKKMLNNGENKLDLRSQAPGIYSIMIKLENEVINKKVVVK